MVSIKRLETYPPPPLSNSVHVYSSSIDAIENQDQLIDSLSPDERARAQRFKAPEHGHRFSLVRGTLRHWLASYLQIDPAEVEFCYNQHGQPLVTNSNASLHFNISHSHEMAAFGFAKRRVGIDIEFIKPIRNLMGMIRYISHPEEFIDFENLTASEQKTIFFKLWTRKEAFIKANGQGLSMGLRSIRIGFKGNCVDKLLYKKELLENWDILDLDCNPAYQLAIAVEKPIG